MWKPMTINESAKRWRKYQEKVRQRLKDRLPPPDWYDGAIRDHAILACAYIESEKTIKELVAVLEKCESAMPQGDYPGAGSKSKVIKLRDRVRAVLAKVKQKTETK